MIQVKAVNVPFYKRSPDTQTPPPPINDLCNIPELCNESKRRSWRQWLHSLYRWVTMQASAIGPSHPDAVFVGGRGFGERGLRPASDEFR